MVQSPPDALRRRGFSGILSPVGNVPFDTTRKLPGGLIQGYMYRYYIPRL